MVFTCWSCRLIPGFAECFQKWKPSAPPGIRGPQTWYSLHIRDPRKWKKHFWFSVVLDTHGNNGLVCTGTKIKFKKQLIHWSSFFGMLNWNCDESCFLNSILAPNRVKVSCLGLCRVVWFMTYALNKARLQVLWAALVCGLWSSFDVILAMWMQVLSWDGWRSVWFLFCPETHSFWQKRKQLTLDSETFVMGAFFYRNSLFL